MTTLATFEFDTQEIRVLDIDSEPWFVAKDICTILDIRDVNDVTRRLKDYEKGTNTIRTPGGNQDVTIISESGLYRLVLTSRKPQAEPFQDWVCQEVIPQIRKTGQYNIQQLTPAEMLLKQAEQLVEVERKQKEIEEKQKLEAQRTDELNDRVQQHDAELERIFKPDGDYFSIRGYAKLKGYNLTIKEAMALGRKASKLSKKQGYPKEKITDPRYGEVGCYSEHILTQVMG